jgi:hypothetical protein
MRVELVISPEAGWTLQKPTPVAPLYVAFHMPCFYEPSEATVSIYAVFHTSRDPDKWRQRLP